MKVIVLGASGMLGTDIVNAFQSVPDFEVHGFASHEVDITNASQVLETLHIQKPEVLINCAAYTNVDAAEEDEELATRVNGYALHNVSEACNEVNAHLLHFSTDYVFSGENPEGYREDALTNPVNAYGRSKLAGEQEIQKYCQSYSIIRTSWLFGKHGKNFVDTIKKLLEEKDEIKVVNDQKGSPTFTEDLAQSIVELAQSGPPSGKNMYHRTNSGVCTWFEFASEIRDLLHSESRVLPCSTEEFPRPAKRPKCSVLLNTKLPHLRNWKEALRDYLE